MLFFEKNLLRQSDVVFDFTSNGRNFSSLEPPGGDKKIFLSFFCAKVLLNDVTSRRARILSFFLGQMKGQKRSKI